MTAQQYGIGQWVRSAPVGKAPAFVGEIKNLRGDEYVVRDVVQFRYYVRSAEQLEPLQ